MDGQHRGYCLIVNNTNFKKLQERRGSHVDACKWPWKEMLIFVSIISLSLTCLTISLHKVLCLHRAGNWCRLVHSLFCATEGVCPQIFAGVADEEPPCRLKVWRPLFKYCSFLVKLSLGVPPVPWCILQVFLSCDLNKFTAGWNGGPQQWERGPNGSGEMGVH